MIQTSRTLIESADVIYSKLTQAQRAGLWGNLSLLMNIRDFKSAHKKPHYRPYFILPGTTS